MDKLKVTLSRKVGPFSVGAWLIVIIAGIALGLMIKKAMGGSGKPDASGTSLPSNPEYGSALGPTQGAPTILQQDFETVTAIRDEQDRFRDEFDNWREGVSDQLDDFFTRVEDRIEQDNIPTDPAPPKTTLPAPKPTPKPTPTPAPAPTGRTYTVVRGDTLKSIAKRLLGSEARNVEIRSLNPQHKGSWDLIHPGEVLTIPAK